MLDTSSIILILLVIVAILIGWILLLEWRLRKLFKGKSGGDLEEELREIHKGVEDYEIFKKDSINYLKNIEARLKRSLQAVETVRFNPFKGTGSGGNQSFSTAFLNERGDGVVISSLYSRDRVSVFSKPVKRFKSEFELTDEERAVMKNAQGALAHQNSKE